MSETEKNPDELVMKFDPRTIEHLGIKMYSRIPTAIAELIANAYDAEAKEVLITLEDGDNKKIIVTDNGEGMTFEEINDKFLIIGRNRREKEGPLSSEGKRKVTGKKGLGKLALFGIGDTIEINTIKDDKRIIFKLDWDELKKSEGDYKPKFEEKPEDSLGKGTTITLFNLKRQSDFNIKDLAISLSKLFNFFDKNFKVSIKKGETIINVDNDLKYSEIEEEFSFPFPNYSNKIVSDYTHKGDINGKIITTELPLKPGLRGITLFANGRLINAPEFFGLSESSHFYSYITGWLDVDFLDDIDEDIISTNRQSLNWDLEESQKLKDFLQKILSNLQKDWREKRAEKTRKAIKEKTKIDVSSWYSKLPTEIVKEIEPVINTIFDKSELTKEEQSKIIKRMHTALPENFLYHYRYLHPLIKKIVLDDYLNQRYFDAAEKASRLYAQKVKEKSGRATARDVDDMNAAFNSSGGILKVTSCSTPTEISIQNGQNHLSQGVVAGCKNPLTHNPEYQRKLVETGLFIEKDCLDLLSTISHLFRRLDNAKTR